MFFTELKGLAPLHFKDEDLPKIKEEMAKAEKASQLHYDYLTCQTMRKLRPHADIDLEDFRIE